MTQAGLAATRELADRYAAVVDTLTDDEWSSPSGCAGWRIQDLVAHASSNYQAVVEPPPPPPADAPAMKAEDAMDFMVQARRDWTHDQVADELRTYQQPWLDALGGLQVEPTASVAVPMSELGTYQLHTLADAFAFDLACHLYADLLGPTTSVRRDVAALDDVTLTPGIGWMLTGLPQMCPQVGDVLARPIGLRLTGAGAGDWTWLPGEPLTVVPGISNDAAAVVTSDAFAFVQWGTVRVPWRDHVAISGDTDHAATVLDAVNII